MIIFKNRTDLFIRFNYLLCHLKDAPTEQVFPNLMFYKQIAPSGLTYLNKFIYYLYKKQERLLLILLLRRSIRFVGEMKLKEFGSAGATCKDQR